MTPSPLAADIESVLFTEEQIRAIVEELADAIDADYGADPRGVRDLVLVGVLRSALHFFSDLSRRLRTPHAIDFIQARSYRDGVVSSGRVEICRAPDLDLAGRDVLIVEDVYDTGRTMERAIDYARALKPRSLEVCALLSKPVAHLIPIDVKYVGREIENRFVVGYGMDFNERFRDLPYLGALKMQETK